MEEIEPNISSTNFFIKWFFFLMILTFLTSLCHKYFKNLNNRAKYIKKEKER